MNKSEIKSESKKEGQESRNVSIRKVDEVYIAGYYYYDSANQEYISYEKTFKTLKEFGTYTEDFLNL